MMLVMLQVAMVLSDADRASFKDYRDCVLLQARIVPMGVTEKTLIETAECGDARLAAGLELAGVDFEQEVAGVKVANDVGRRMDWMERELIGDVQRLLSERRNGVKK